MKIISPRTVALIVLSGCGVMSARAVPPATVAELTTAANTATVTANTATSTLRPSQPAVVPPAVVGRAAGTPTLGDWEDLTQRQAYKKQMDELNGAAQPAAGPMSQLPGGPLPMPGAVPPVAEARDKPAPKRRISEACPADNSPCFYAVYGMNVEGVGNNYRGMVAIDGHVYPVQKGARFAEFTVDSISVRELVVTDTKTKRKRTLPFAGDADVAADPAEVSEKTKPAAARPTMFGPLPTAMQMP